MASPRGRVVLFLGKGGVGKTTLAAGYALKAARAGERVLLLSATSATDAKDLLDHEGGGGHANLVFRVVEPKTLVDDVFRKILRLGPIADAIFRHPSYESFVGIAPGIRELAFLNHIFGLQAGGEWDRIVVDGPATGHGVNFLEAPGKARRILVGRLSERASEIVELLQDASRAGAVIVTLAEEMPARETEELAARLGSLNVAIDGIVANKWLPDVFEDAESVRILDELRANPKARGDLARAIDPESRLDVEPLVDAVHVIRSQREENVGYLGKLRGLGAPLDLVPFLTGHGNRLTEVGNALSPAVAKARGAEA